MYGKIKSEQANLAIPARKSYLQENILLLQEIHKRRKKKKITKKPHQCFLLQARAVSVSLEDFVYLFFPKEKKLKLSLVPT